MSRNCCFLVALCLTLVGTAASAAPIADAGGPYFLPVGGASIIIDGLAGSTPDPGEFITAFDWDLNFDGVYGDIAPGPSPAVSDTLLQSLGIPVVSGSSISVALRITQSDGLTAQDYATIHIVPEPSTALLLAIGLAGIAMRRGMD